MPALLQMAPWDRVLSFWFDPSTAPRWFSKAPEFDAVVKKRFGRLVQSALDGKLDSWTKEDPKGALALVVLLDQFPRNIYRGMPKAFAGDARALKIAKALDTTTGFTVKERVFAYLPYEHSESMTDQKVSTALFRTMAAEHPTNELAQVAAKYAKKHAYVIRRFGRFPHRNAVLGRKSTAEEITFLQNNPTYAF
jgi:uncharacterized protein (DUF924 family)